MRRTVVVLWALMLLVFAGCSKPPVEEEKRALDALEQARQAEADTYAPEAFAAAQDTLDAALKERERQDERFSLLRSYNKAREKFLRVESLAGRAAERARQVKSQRVEECRDRADSASAVVDSCAALLERAPKGGKGTRTDLKVLKDDIAALAEQLSTAYDLLDEEKYAECMTRADSVLVRADSLRLQIEQAISRRK